MSSFKFSLVSDLHIDFPQPKTPYHLLEPFVVVAGDTSNGLGGLKFLQKLKNKGFDVFAVDGNHEMYSNRSQGRTPAQTETQFYEGLNQGHERVLDNGLLIVGYNGWYPVEDEELWYNYMNDSRNGCINANMANNMATSHAHRIDYALKAHDGPAIVVTHTAPCEETLNPDYFGYFSNAWYWNPLMREVLAAHSDKILVWCHGHSHAPADKTIDGVRVVCQPRGYPGEQPNWTPKTINIEW